MLITNNRFNKFLDLNLKTGCINWTGSKDKDGYGYFKDKKTIKAHRYAYLHCIGEIGDYHVLHKCDNPSCVNPEHLFLGTNKDNMQDKVSKGRQFHYSRPMHGMLNSHRKLDQQDVNEIRDLYPYYNGVQLSKLYGVTPTQICRILNNTSWNI